MKPEWAEGARHLLAKTSPTAAPIAPDLSGVPLYSLGPQIGEGVTSVVVAGSSAGGSSLQTLTLTLELTLTLTLTLTLNLPLTRGGLILTQPLIPHPHPPPSTLTLPLTPHHSSLGAPHDRPS